MWVVALRGRAFFVFAALWAVAPKAAQAHAFPTPILQGPVRVRGNLLVDASGQTVLLRGAVMPGLESAAPGAAERETVAAMTTLTFRILRQRWNMNSVRLPVGVPIWQREGQSYLNRVDQIVKAANEAGLVVVLAAVEDPRSGAAAATGLPSPAVAAFWRTWAAFFKDNPKVIFSLFHQPSARQIPGHVDGRRLGLEWQFWLRGGTAVNGRPATGMQELLDVIRSAGATQVVAVPAFHDELAFLEFEPEFYIRDANVIYEVHPHFDVALTDAERDGKFGYLAGLFPLYAGEWGLTLLEDQPSCRRFPRDLLKANEILFQTFSYFETRAVSWTALAFQPQRLILDFTTYEPTRLDRLWTCGQVLAPQPGMGEYLLLWLTGDPTGFGAISPDLIASAAGGPSGPVAPGQIVSIYGFLIGPEQDTFGQLDASGLLPTSVGETRVLFDGVAAPLFFAGPYQILVQAPYSVAGKTTSTVQVIHRDVPSNVIKLPVVDAAPEIFTAFGGSQVVAANQDGRRNSSSAAAEAGSVVVVYATGAGQISPSGVSGRPARAPLARPVLPVRLAIDRTPAEILYAGEAPGFVGLIQINAVVPPSPIPPITPAVRAVPIVLSVGDRSSRSAVTIWVR